VDKFSEFSVLRPLPHCSATHKFYGVIEVGWSSVIMRKFLYKN